VVFEFVPQELADLWPSISFAQPAQQGTDHAVVLIECQVGHADRVPLVKQVREVRALPAGVRFTAEKNGRATISGIPAKSTRDKTYVIRFTARNGVGNAAVQRFTLRVSQLGGDPSPHWASLADWVLFAVNTTGNNTQIRQ
jgi:hypothetical protein